MSADNVIFLQRCQDGIWRAWEQSASVDPERPARGFICELPTREAAIISAFDWDQEHGTEYGISQLEPEAASVAASDHQPRAACNYSRHEALDRASLLCDMLDSHLLSHKYVQENPRLRDKADEAMKLLAALYQEIGAEHF